MTKEEILSLSRRKQEELAILATDEDYYVRYWIARNPNTPIETLVILATDEDVDVRYWIASNPNATEEICLMIRAYEKYGHLVNCHTSST